MMDHQKTHLIFCLTRVCERFLLCTPGITSRRWFLQFCLNWGIWNKTYNRCLFPLYIFLKTSRSALLTSLQLQSLYVWEETVCWALRRRVTVEDAVATCLGLRGPAWLALLSQQGSILSGGKGESSLLYTFITKCKLRCFTTRKLNLPWEQYIDRFLTLRLILNEGPTEALRVHAHVAHPLARLEADSRPLSWSLSFKCLCSLDV